MRVDEFIELHGQEVWDGMVKPQQEVAEMCDGHKEMGNLCHGIRGNANVIVHERIMVTLYHLGFRGKDVKGILDAKKIIKEFREYIKEESAKGP